MHDLETTLSRSEEHRERELIARLEHINSLLADERNGLQEARVMIQSLEAARDEATTTLNSVRLECNRWAEISQEKDNKINVVERQICEDQTKVEELQSQIKEIVTATSEEIIALKEEKKHLKEEIQSQTSELRRSEKTIKELQTTKVQNEESLEMKLKAKDTRHNEVISEMASDFMQTKQDLDSKIRDLELQLQEYTTQQLRIRGGVQEASNLSQADAFVVPPDLDDSVDINFEFQEEDGTRRHPHTRKMSRSELKRTLQKAIRKGLHPMTTRGRGLDPLSAWDVVVNDGTRTIVETRMSRIGFLDPAPHIPTKPTEQHVEAAEEYEVLPNEVVTTSVKPVVER